MMTNTELLQALRRQHVMCAGFETDDLATDRERALDYYHQRPNGTEVEGRSTVVSGDVSASVESNLAAMMEAFSSPNLASFDPLGPEDVDQAQLESDAVVDVVMRQSGGRWQLAQAVKETLRLRNGWTKAFVEEDRRAKIEEFRGVAPEAVPSLIERPGVECKILAYDPEDGYLKLRCVYVAKVFRIYSVATENIVYPKAYDGCDFEALQRIPYIAERHIETRSEAIKRGFSREKVERIPEYRSDGNTVSAARNPRKDPSLTPGHDTATELIEWLEIYTLVDGDGIAERQKICTDGKFDEMLLRDAANVVPYSTGQCFIAPNRLTGISIWDKLRQTQDVNTGLQRAQLDNVEAANKSRIAALDGKVNMDDATDGRVTGVLRVKPSVTRVSDAVMAFVVPDTSAGTIAAMDQQRRIRAELGGAALDMQTNQVQFGRQMGSEGLDRAYSVAEQLAAHMTQNVADTLVRSTFLVAHAQMREHFTEPVPIKVGGRWQTATPSEWIPRTQLTVNVGMSPGERARRAAAIDKIIQSQIQMSTGGLDDILVNVDGFYTALMDWGRVADVPNPERYFIDPMSEGSRKVQEQKRALAQLQQQAQQQLVKQAVDLEKLRTAFDKYKADMEAAIEVWAKKVDAKLEYAKLNQEADIAEMDALLPTAIKAIEAKRGQANGSTAAQSESTATADA